MSNAQLKKCVQYRIENKDNEVNNIQSNFSKIIKAFNEIHSQIKAIEEAIVLINEVLESHKKAIDSLQVNSLDLDLNK